MATSRRAQEFWAAQIQRELPILELPFDANRQSGAWAAARIDHVVAVDGLDALAAQHAASIDTVVLAAYAVWLYRYASQDELVVGVASPVGALPLRLDFAARPRFAAVIAEVREREAAARDFADADELAAQLAAQHRASSLAPTFQAMFAAGDAPLVGPFDLGLRAAWTAEGLALSLGYDPSVLAPATAARMLASFTHLLAGAVRDPDEAVHALPLLTDAERHQVVVAFNQTARPYPADRLLHELVEAQVDRAPDADAVVFANPAPGEAGRTLSYRALDRYANALALHLQSLGVAPDAFVGLYLERSPALIASMLAVTKAGGAYLPLDPTYPSDRLAYMLEDAKVGVVITRGAHFAFLRAKYPAATLVDADAFAAGADTRPACPARPADLAYIIYTSGSTGRPKGVMLPHAPLANFVAWLVRNYALGPADRCLHFISPSFDVSVWEIFAALASGATLVISARQDPTSLARVIHDERVTFAVFMPSILESLMAEPLFRDATHLRTVTCGAEALSVALQDAYLALGRALHNAGGTTETAVASVYWRCATGAHRVVPYGKPIDNNAIYLVDDRLAPVPIGVRGEMYIGGAGLARGFANRPELTAARFLPDPFADAPGARMYATGDYARWLPDGSLELLGRVDEQIKIRGFRIELGEIGSVLAQHPALRESIVVAKGSGADRRLVGYVVGKDARPEPAALRAWLAQRLPEYMVPSAIVALDAMPTLPNGKLDKNALPAPTSSAAYVAPRDPAERALAAIWQALLGAPRIGVDDDFFELGGHSLMATQLVSRVRTAFGVELPLRAVFEQPTIARLAAAIAGEAAVSAPPLVARPRPARPPLSFAQQRLWFLDQYEPGPAYNEAIAIRLTGALDASALGRAIDAVVARHEALRTTFAVDDAGAPYQVIHAAAAIALPRIAVASEAEAEARAVAEARQPFDLVRGPLLRLALFALAPDDATLLLAMHHIVGDDWSLGALWNEVAAHYDAFVRGVAPDVPPLAVQYADFAAWQRDYLAGDTLARQLGYWKAQLAGAPQIIELPTDHPRPPTPSHRGASYGFVLGAARAERLERLGRALNATPFMVLLAAFQALLHRYTRQTDVVVGSVVANRNRAEIEPLIGFFVNTLVYRTDLGGAPTFHALVARVREVALGAYDHQDVPFERLVEALQPERALGHTPLYQVMFVLQNASEPRALPGLAQRMVELDIGIAKFDLTLVLEDRGGDGLRGRFEYATDLFERDTIARMADHFARLLDEVARDPDRAVGTLPLLGDTERAQLAAWNATAQPYPRDVSLAALFEAQVDRAPDALAVVHRDARLRYRELDARANQLAHVLRAHGVGPDVIVGVCMERSLELVIALVAILKAGGAYLPLDPGYPAERLAFMLEDTATPVVIASPGAPLPRTDARIVHVDDGATPDRGACAATADSLAYVTYTSGSTGRPKGVLLIQRAVARLVIDTNYLQVRPDDVFLQLAPIAFDASTFELWGALLNGAALVVPPPGALSLEDIGRVIVSHRATVMLLTTPLFHQMVEHQLDALAGARQILTGGDVLSVAHARRAVEHLPVTVWNAYGPTENTVITTAYEIPRQLPARSIAIGPPIANTTVAILEPSGLEAPIGVPGELHAGGDGLARGYLNRPELTAEKFIETPLGRLYRTGDLARWLPDGNVEFLGRIDHQVKVRGFRIELGELESAIAEHPTVREVAVVVYEAAPGDKRLVAYLVGEPGAIDASPTGALRTALAARLPAYMLPTSFLVVDALPQTPNGKVDRKALASRAPVQERAELVPPRTAAERAVAQIFEEVLGTPAGAHDNFFALGGHSLLATQVIARVRAAFGLEVPLRAVFEAPTVAQLAAVIERGAAPSANAPIARSPRTGSLPLSFAQQRLWFLDRLEPNSPFYNVALPVRLVGALDVARLARALQLVVDRHDALRTTFATRDGLPAQVVAPALAIALPVDDLGGFADREAEARRRAIAAARATFDLARGPLFCARVLRLADDEHWLLLAFHHIISDAWSVEVVWRELAIAYAAFAEDRAPALPALAIQYPDFAAWQRAWLTGDVLEAQLAHWRTQLRGSPTLLELPTDRPRPPVRSSRGALYWFAISAEVTAGIKALAQREVATPFMALLAAFDALLVRHSGQVDLMVGTPVANRTRAETEALVGFFVNTLVLRTDASGDPSFRSLLARVRETALAAYSHQDVPFERLVEELRPERSLAYAPLFQVMFDLVVPAAATRIPGMASSLVEIDGGTAKFDLGLMLEERDGGLRGTFEYSTDLYDEPTIARMAGHYARLLEAVVAEPDRAISSLPMLSDDEYEDLVVGFNATARAYPTEPRIVARFEHHAATSPARVAVVLDGRTLSYGALDGRANALAHQLIARGVGPGALVGVAMERSFELVVALVAILKAGAAYVPLDPDYPTERLAFMIEDARPRVVLIQPHLRAAIPTGDAPVLIVEDSDAARATSPGIAVERIHPIYVIYTSGSTGRPKGVINTHGGAENHLAWLTEAFAFGPDDAILQKTPFSFDASVWELLLPLATGARLVLARPGGQQDPSYMARVVRDEAVTVLQFVPSMLSLFLEAKELAGATRVRHVVAGGEALPQSLAHRFRERLPSAVLHNMYGQTEASDDTSHWACGGDEPAIVPIGRPIGNVQMYVLDRALAPTPIGVVGEIFVGGAGLAHGYLARPALTAERFVPDPFSGVPGARLYRTGDLARMRADRAVEFLGRVDHQIKLRGFRIELGEVEAELATAPGVREVIAIVRDDARGPQLVAYLAGDVDAEALRAQLAARLPEYMVPSVIIVLDALPLTPNGKVDRAALPVPAARTASDAQAPRTRGELAIAQIFGELLGLAHVGPGDDFFALGGHSLLAVQLFARIEDRLGVALPLATVFRAPTVEALARELEREPLTSPLVALRTSASASPAVVFVHPIGGSVIGYQPLVARLGDRACFGLEARGLVGGAPASSIAAIVDDYAAALADLGPVHLVGWSFGGVVALALAAALGDRVRSTTLIDAFAPADDPPLAPDAIVALLAQDLGLDVEPRGDRDAALAHVAERAHAAGILPGHVGAAQLARRLAVIEAHLAAERSHAPVAPPTRVALIRGQHALDAAPGWRAIVPGLAVHDAPGDHFAMVRPPHVDALARVLVEILDGRGSPRPAALPNGSAV